MKRPTLPRASKHANGYWQAYSGGALISGDFHRRRKDALAYASDYAKTGRFDAAKHGGFKP